jgi:hypothetical protein
VTLSDFAAIAEIVGAGAIVVTIIYLAVQVKHSRESLDANTKAIRGQAVSDVTSNIADHMAMVTQGHDVANVIKRMGADEILESEDDVFRSLHHITLTVLKTKSGMHWWQHEGRNLVAPEFVGFTEELLEKRSSDSLESWKRSIHLSNSKN